MPTGRGGGFRIPGGRGGGLRLPIGRRSGGGLSTIVILIVLFFVLRACGIDPMVLLDPNAGGGGFVQPQTSVEPSAPSASDDEAKQFISTVLAETEESWSGIFEASGQTYQEPVVVLFRGQVQSACGFASAASGPFYCPQDQKIYIDLSFYDKLEQSFGASGDFAEAYVLAHEVGHHVQNLTGVLPEFNRQRQAMGQREENAMSVRVELQADCYAGIWAYYTDRKGILEAGDIEEALNAATQIGDDTLQKRTQGYVVPESFNHGTSEQRRSWFARGYESGRVSACDTFNDPA